MSLPPSTVHIKRKRTDEPVDLLRIEAHKKIRIASHSGPDFVFTLQPSIVAQATPPSHRRIKQLPQSNSANSLATAAAGSIPYAQFSQSTVPQVERSGRNGPEIPASSAYSSVSAEDPPKSSIASREAQVRRFHISRTNSSISESPKNGAKRKDTPTIFIERRKRSRTPPGGPASVPPKDVATVQKAESEVVYKQKKPGRAARISTPPVKVSPAPLRNVRMASGAVLPWDVSSEKLAAEMQAYTLQEIGRNLAEAESGRPKPRPAVANRQSTPSKFKPKKPALRYAERHPGTQADSAMDIDEEFVEDEDIDESEYIIDTYIRVPAESLETTEKPKNIGLLILESQPDIDEFYREEEDSEEEEDDDDEDENAEDHYTADYPEDEVDSDDEFDRNAYNYRNGNASDNEEYDEDDDVEFSDGEGSKYPWSKQPVWMRPQKNVLGDD